MAQPFPRRPVPWLALGVGMTLLWGCSSSMTTSVTQPSGSKCDVSVAASVESIPRAGGSGTLTVSTARDCTWAVTTDAEWIAILSGSRGQGDGSTAYRAAANPQAAVRRAALRVNDVTLFVSQAAACTFAVTPSAITAPAEGTSVELRVTTADDCEWTLSSNADWLRLDGAGQGTRGVALQVAANRGDARSASVTVAAQTVTVIQAAGTAPACVYTIDPSQREVPPGGGAVDVTVATGPQCSWTAASSVPWISIARPAGATGPATTTLTVASNPGGGRTGTVTIAGTPFTVVQSPVPCGYTVAPVSHSMAAMGGSGSIAVTSGSDCPWTAVSNALPWLTVTTGASGAAHGSVGFAVSANTGSPRTGTLTVAGQTVTVSQAAPCGFSLSAPGATVAAGGGTGSVGVRTAAGCGWTAASDAGWLTVTGASAGTGNGSVTFAAAANSGAVRIATIVIEGLTFTVTQAAPAPACVYALDPTRRTVSASGGAGTFTVTTPAGCAWTARSNAGWIAITSSLTGTGPGTVAYVVAPRSGGGGGRSGTIEVATQTFTIRQERED